MSLLDGIRHLFSRNDHCDLHASFEPGCEACQVIQRDIDGAPVLFGDDSVNADSFLGGGSDVVDTSGVDAGGSDFGGFDGGDSGGGGSSGDF